MISGSDVDDEEDEEVPEEARNFKRPRECNGPLCSIVNKEKPNCRRNNGSG
jgi:hypothetical protein